MTNKTSKRMATLLSSLLLVAAMGLPACGKQDEQAAEETEAVEQVEEKTEDAEATEDTTEAAISFDEGLKNDVLDASKSVLAMEDADPDDELDDFPEAEVDEIDDLEMPETVSEVEEPADKASMTTIATSGVGITIPNYWSASYDQSTDQAVFSSTRYDLAGYINTWNKSELAIPVTSAASQHVRALVNGGMFDGAYIEDTGTLRSSGQNVGSYVVFVGVRGSQQYACQTVYIVGRTKVSNVFMMFNVRDADAANPDATAAFASLGYTRGEAI